MLLQVTVANTPSILTEAGTALSANVDRKGWMLQNLGTNPIYIRLGSGASSSLFHIVVKGGTGLDDGTGGSYNQVGGVIYTGLVSVAGTSPRLIVTELI